MYQIVMFYAYGNLEVDFSHGLHFIVFLCNKIISILLLSFQLFY